MSNFAKCMLVAGVVLMVLGNSVTAQTFPLRNGFVNPHTRPVTPFVIPPPPAPTRQFSVAPASPLIVPPYMKMVTRLPASSFVPAPFYVPPTLALGNGVTIPNPFPPRFPPNWDYSLNNPYRFYAAGLYNSQLAQWVADFNRTRLWYQTFPWTPYPDYSNPYSNPYTYGNQYLYGSPFGYGSPSQYGLNPYGGTSDLPGMGVAAQGAMNPPNNFAPRQPEAKKPALAFQGIPTEGGQIQWPLALRLLPATERTTLDKLGTNIELLGMQSATGNVNPNLQQAALQSVEQLRRWLQAHDADMAEQTYLEGLNFLRQVEGNLKQQQPKQY